MVSRLRGKELAQRQRTSGAACARAGAASVAVPATAAVPPAMKPRRSILLRFLVPVSHRPDRTPASPFALCLIRDGCGAKGTFRGACAGGPLRAAPGRWLNAAVPYSPAARRRADRPRRRHRPASPARRLRRFAARPAAPPGRPWCAAAPPSSPSAVLVLGLVALAARRCCRRRSCCRSGRSGGAPPWRWTGFPRGSCCRWEWSALRLRPRRLRIGRRGGGGGACRCCSPGWRCASRRRTARFMLCGLGLVLLVAGGEDGPGALPSPVRRGGAALPRRGLRLARRRGDGVRHPACRAARWLARRGAAVSGPRRRRRGGDRGAAARRGAAGIVEEGGGSAARGGAAGGGGLCPRAAAARSRRPGAAFVVGLAAARRRRRGRGGGGAAGGVGGGRRSACRCSRARLRPASRRWRSAPRSSSAAPTSARWRRWRPAGRCCWCSARGLAARRRWRSSRRPWRGRRGARGSTGWAGWRG